MKFAHIINPVMVPPESDLYRAQPVTFASLSAARDYAQQQGIEVELLACCYPEDRELIPADFRATAELQRSVLDCGQFQRPRKLPLIADILERAFDSSDADYLIYSNVDIGVLPHFHASIAALIEQGSDALVINRRTIPATFDSPDALPLIYAQAGDSHPGYDCFIFRRDLYPRLLLREVCIGATAIGLVLTANLLKLASRFALHEQLHLSFHLGDDQHWRRPEYDDYRRHNEQLAGAILAELEQRHGPFSANGPGWIYDYLQQLRSEQTTPDAQQPVTSISVITVTLDAADSIALTLDSVREQTLADIQHIVIDGGSSDGTQQIVRAAGVDILISEPDQGIYDAMEKGKALATGDAAVFLNAGDVFADAEVCSDALAYFNDSGATIIFGNFTPYLINDDDAYQHAFQPEQTVDMAWMTNSSQLADTNIHHQALFYGREVLQACSFFSAENPQGSDWEFNIRAIVEHGFRTCYFPRTVARFALGGLTTSNHQREQQGIERLRSLLRRKYFATPQQLTDQQFHCQRASAATPATLPAEPAKPAKAMNKLSFLRKLRARLPYVRSQRAIWEELSRLTPLLGNEQTGMAALNGRVSELKERLDAQQQQRGDDQHALQQSLREIHRSLQSLAENSGQLLTSTVLGAAPAPCVIPGFRVSSQFDEDGIIQYLINSIDIADPSFIEFGVEDYREANTRFLLTHNNWKGLVMDASARHISSIERSDLFWRHQLQALRAFVTRDNINDLFGQAGFSGDIGLLSIDVDGVDYWLWEACTSVEPRIVIVEYNSAFGSKAAVTVPYDPAFDRAAKHYSHIYAGASLAALEKLGKRKGYSLVSSNNAGNNAFFVRNDCLGSLSPCSAEQAYVKARFRESRDQRGQLNYLPIEESVKLIGDMPVVDIDSGDTVLIKDIELCYD